MPHLELPSGPIPPSQEVSDRIVAEVSRSLTPARLCSSRHRLWGSLGRFGGLTLLAGAALVFLAGIPAAPQWLMSACCTFAGGIGLSVGLAQSRAGAIVTKAAVTLGLSICFVVFSAAIGGAPVTGPEQQAVTGCLVLAGLIALPPLLGVLALWHRADAATPRWSGAVVGAATGIVGAGGASLGCPATDPQHLLLAHGSLVGLGAIVGAAFFSRWLAP